MSDIKYFYREEKDSHAVFAQHDGLDVGSLHWYKHDMHPDMHVPTPSMGEPDHDENEYCDHCQTAGHDYMLHERQEGQVGHVDVHPQYRRRGIATKMWQHAHNLAPRLNITPPQHSGWQTPEGKSWAESVDRGAEVHQQVHHHGVQKAADLDLYHRTTPDAAAAILKQKRMDSKERGDVFFSTHRNGGNSEGYGSAVVHVRVPDHLPELDDEFPDGEQHYRLHNRDLQPHHFVGTRVVADDASERDAHLLQFRHQEWETGGSKYPNGEMITAHHPEHGQVGHVKYLRGTRANSPILIDRLEVHPDHQRKGYGSAVMDTLQDRYPKARINHGDRTDAGKAWWSSYGQGANRRGRTSALATVRTIHAQADGPTTVRYIRNPESSTVHGDFGEQYGQHIEPAGRYLSEQHRDHVPEGWEFGEVHFHNPLRMEWGGGYDHPSNWKQRLHRQYGTTGHELSKAIAADGHDGIITHDKYGTSEIVDLTHLHRRTGSAIQLNVDHDDHDPSTWHEDYQRWAREKPHAVAVSQAQEHVRMHAPTMNIPLGSEEDATSACQHMLRRGGHPLADEGHAYEHPNVGWGQSQAYRSEGIFPHVAIHPSRWDYGTLAHEVAHHLHEHHDLGGRKAADDAEAHGPGFIQHYQNVLKGFGRGASEKLGEHYHQALGRIRPEAKIPNKRIFGPTYGLDHRLFDGEHLKADVTHYVLGTLDGFLRPLYGAGWQRWMRVYLAGSEASEWTSKTLEGNNDFDVLVGVHYDRARADVRPFADASDQEITDALNAHFREGLMPRTSGDHSVMITIDGHPEGPFDNTFYCNPDSWDIVKIKPYAAYDITSHSWAVKPPHLPDWDVSKFPEGHAMIEMGEAYEKLIAAIFDLPEPYRTQQGNALWTYLHTDRSRAFGPNGEGWYDIGNVMEKWLDQDGIWKDLWAIHHRAEEDPTTLLAPANWSNDPQSASPQM